MKRQGSDPVPIAFVLSSCDSTNNRQTLELLRRLNPARWQIHVAYLNAHGHSAAHVADVASVRDFVFSGFRRSQAIPQTLEFIRWCRERDVAVVHTVDLNANVFAVPASAAAGVPVRIASRRDIVPDATRGQIVAQRAAYQFAHKVVASCQAGADRLRLERVPAGRIAVVPNGVDSAAFATIRPKRPLRRVVVVAALHSRRGHDVLIDAAPEVLRRFPDARFEIVGDGPERANLEARARAQGIAASCVFAGQSDDVARHLHQADMFVFPSRTDAYPNAVLEAMSAGLPIIASGLDGLSELIDDGQSGLLVPPGDPRALAHSICRVMENRALGERLGCNAAQEAQRYSFSRMTSSLELLYIAELNRRGAALGQAHALAS